MTYKKYGLIIVTAILVVAAFMIATTACSNNRPAKMTTNTSITNLSTSMTITQTLTETERTIPDLSESAFDLSVLNRDSPPATWSNLSWMKDTSPVTLTMFVDASGYVGSMDGWGNEKKALLSPAEGNGTTHSWKGYYEQNLPWIVPVLLFVTWIS